MKKGSILLFVLLSCVGCDQVTKYTAKYYLEGKRSFSYVGDTLRLGYAENTGAFLSLGSDLPDIVRTIIFTVLAGVFLLGFAIYLLKNNTITRKAMIAGSLIVAGGVGNLIDRVVNDGAVIDFLNVGIGSLRTGIFNVADMSIMAGIFLFLWATHESEKQRQEEENKEQDMAEGSPPDDPEAASGSTDTEGKPTSTS